MQCLRSKDTASGGMVLKFTEDNSIFQQRNSPTHCENGQIGFTITVTCAATYLLHFTGCAKYCFSFKQRKVIVNLFGIA
jgi:hypothetical protein